MPVLGYCVSVGSALIMLLFVTDFYLPKQPLREEAHHNYNIQIAAAMVGREVVTFSGETRNFGPPPPMTVRDLAVEPPAPEQPRQPGGAQTAQAHAQTTVAAKRDTKPARKRVARRKPNPSYENRFANIPDQWQRPRFYSGMAFARPFGW